MELSQESTISSDPKTKGFDLSAGTVWVYPLNYQFREYQYDIARNSLFGNTLVCLPTGLGKTLIAAVVMFNFWRWYPRGKIVFLAPTKPLVAQQINACHDIMGIPSRDTIELTGSMNPKNREIAWLNKRVIFATPQVFQNDLEKNIVSGDLVRCVVIDEAHKALGKHSYCESIRLLKMQNSCFRVLALSATPGSRIEDVCQVMQNLLISNLELRDETSRDIIPYLNKRQMDIILVPLNADLARFKEKYVSIMDRWVRLLVQYNIIKGDASTISKGRIFYLYREFQAKTARPANYSQIMRTLGRCMSLYHAYELLIRHGLRAFASFCQTHSADVWMTDEPALQNLIDEILTFLGPFPNFRPLPDGSVDEIPNNVVFGHTKFHKLKSLLMEHFNKFAAKNEDTRAIVFVEYRDSVDEVYVALLQLRPMLRPKMFVGQSGQKRKQQMQAMQAFRNNEANVLISTSVGEEGLDVGEVDLIVCFDISQSSPIRLVQRMGRTGRKRDGRIVMLVTDGKEHQSLKSTIAKKDSLNKKVLHSSNVISALYQESPRMVPPDLNPECSKIHLAVPPVIPAAKGKRKRKESVQEQQQGSKKKATAAKNHGVVPGNFEKSKPGQSSMLNFFKKSSVIEDPRKVSIHVSQPSQSKQSLIQISQTESVKLLTSDSAALEFLTLCAIKESKLDGARNELDKMDETYLAMSPCTDVDHLFHYPVPDLDILNSIALLEEQTQLPSPQDDDFEFNHIDNHVYELQGNAVDYRDTNNLPAVGSFDFEALLEDSSESDTTIFLDDQEDTTAIENQEKFPADNANRKLQVNDESSAIKEKLSDNENDDFYAALLEDDFFDEPGVADLVIDQASDAKKQENKEEDNLLNTGCFESILDESSDSDIPNSQGELDSRICKRVRRVSPPNRSEINSNANSKIVNKPVEVNESFNCNDSKSLCLPINPRQTVDVNMHTDTSSRFFASEDKSRPSLKIGSQSRTKANDKVVDSWNGTKSETNNSSQSVYKDFEEILDDDDDVIFIGEVNESARDIERQRESTQRPVSEDSDEVVFEKEISIAERSRANELQANSSKYGLTQILELIEKSTPSRLNLNKISKRAQTPLSHNNSKLVSASINVSSEKTVSSHNKTAPKDEASSPKNIISNYFSRENHAAESVDAGSKPKEPLEIDLDLSDIRWEDDFEVEKEQVDSTQASFREVEGINSAFGQMRSNIREKSLMNKKEKVDFDKPEIFSESNTKMAKSSSPPNVMDFDLGNYEWDSDFEDPTNPVESLKRFSKPDNTSSPNTFKDGSAQGLGSKKLAGTNRPEPMSSLAASMKRNFTTKKSEAFKPSTSWNFPDDDSDVENFFQKHDGKQKSGKDNNPNINFVLTTSRKNGISKKLKSEKENIQPNSGFIDLSTFSANGKNKLPFSRGVSVPDRKKTSSLDRYPVKKMKKGGNRNKIKSEFLDYEASVSPGTSSGSSGDDDDLHGFVSYTQQAPEVVDMQGHYLQSIRDAYKPGAYHFKKPRTFVPDDEVFSQPNYQAENSTYLHDSFCVSSGADADSSETNEESFLESTERALNSRKRKSVKNGRSLVAKKRKITEKSADSNSSEDETEKLRKQILDESLILKRKKN